MPCHLLFSKDIYAKGRFCRVKHDVLWDFFFLIWCSRIKFFFFSFWMLQIKELEKSAHFLWQTILPHSHNLRLKDISNYIAPRQLLSIIDLTKSSSIQVYPISRAPEIENDRTCRNEPIFLLIEKLKKISTMK